MTVNNELQRCRRKQSWPTFGYLSRICLEALRKAIKISVCIFGIPAEIRIRYLPRVLFEKNIVYQLIKNSLVLEPED
jgi:hypothetical protein